MGNDRFILNRNSDVKVIYIGTGQFQLASGKWVDAILYKYKGVYKMMEASEFIKLAEPDRSTTLDKIGDIIGPGCEPVDDKNQIDANPPLYTDYEAMSSDGASIAENGEIDSTPTMQNALKPKKQKTVTDMVQDQLGPGYTPGFGGDKTQIPAYEVECEDPAKDDPNAANEYFQKIIKLKEEKPNNEDSNRAK